MRDWKLLALALIVVSLWAWNQGRYGPYWLEFRYGVESPYVERFSTPRGVVEATLVPMTLDPAGTVDLVIPQEKAPHRLYLRDRLGDHPIYISEEWMGREPFLRSEPSLVERWIRISQGSQSAGWHKEILAMSGQDFERWANADIQGMSRLGILSKGTAAIVYDLASRR